MGNNRYSVRVLQFGTGNFLRGFADWMIQVANDKLDLDLGIAMVQSISHDEKLQNQNFLYHVVMKGTQNGELKQKITPVTSIQRIVNGQDREQLLLEAENPLLEFIISNTTETGIKFDITDDSPDRSANSFPGKLTQLLFRRWHKFPTKRLAIIPCELIERNGQVLRNVIQQYANYWSYPIEFSEYLDTNVSFCDTLVDRIVSGFPKDPEPIWQEIGTTDKLLTVCEWYHLWAIEAPNWVIERFPLHKAGVNLFYTNDIAPFRDRKVKILNGLHTIMAPIGIMMSLKTVEEAVNDDQLGLFLKKTLHDEILPFVKGDSKELEKYASEVFERYKNPAIQHYLINITLYSFSKFKVRLLPSLKAYFDRHCTLPMGIVHGLAALIVLYQGKWLDKIVPLNDEQYILEFFQEHWGKYERGQLSISEFCESILSNEAIMGEDLRDINGLNESIASEIEMVLNRRLVSR